MSINLEKRTEHPKRPSQNTGCGQAILGVLIILGAIALFFTLIWLIWGAIGICWILWILGGICVVVAVAGLLMESGMGCMLTIVGGIIAAMFFRGANYVWNNYVDTQPEYQYPQPADEGSPSSSVTDVQGEAHVMNEPQESSENVTDELQEPSDNYNRLETGDVPYTNHKARGRGESEIRIKTSSGRSQSDVVVIVKQQDKIVRNVYIQAGDTYTIAVPNGKYQVFFYSGRGWSTEKPMGTEQTGGFVEDESFQKDAEVAMENQILEYELILQRNGDFQTKQSNKQEMFQ